MAKRTRGNGDAKVFRRKNGGPNWIASWYGADGKRIERSTRTTSFADANRIKKKWAERAVMEREGLVAPEGGTELDQHAAAPIETHLHAFTSAKKAEGLTERHVTETSRMIARVIGDCEWSSLVDFNPEELERFIERKRAAAERPWSSRTAHKYVTALRTFTRWCVSDGRLAADPLARVKKPKATRERIRRFLLTEEWRWLRDSCESAHVRWNMTGHARRLLYELAIQTGMRSGELRSLKRSSLILGGDCPHILLEASQTKNRKAARQYIKPALADELTRFIAHTMPGAAVFDMPLRGKVATMLRHDLADARQAWIDDSRDNADERCKREASDYLSAENHDGHKLDFHALRHTCGVWAAQGGASPKAIQTLMRHSSITLTLDTYGHLLPDEAAETVHRMPDVEPLRFRLTGTDDVLRDDETPAVDYATAGRSHASPCSAVQNEQPRFAAGGPGNAVSKRGGRDSNPQPPDRQSGTLTN